jgi:hypothetical protein
MHRHLGLVPGAVGWSSQQFKVQRFGAVCLVLCVCVGGVNSFHCTTIWRGVPGARGLGQFNSIPSNKTLAVLGAWVWSSQSKAAQVGAVCLEQGVGQVNGQSTTI